MGAYLREVEQYGFLPMFMLELTDGLRHGELLAPHWDNMGVKNRILSVGKQVTRSDGDMVVTEPKTKTPYASWLSRSKRQSFWCGSVNSTP